MSLPMPCQRPCACQISSQLVILLQCQEAIRQVSLDIVLNFGYSIRKSFVCNKALFILFIGGDDRRVVLWKFGQAILNSGKPEAMSSLHNSNIFCLGITRDNQKIYSGGNDDTVSIKKTRKIYRYYLIIFLVRALFLNLEFPFMYKLGHTICVIIRLLL